MIKIKLTASFAVILLTLTFAHQSVYSQKSKDKIDKLKAEYNPAKCKNGTERACFDYSKLRSLCGAVSEKAKDSGGYYSFDYMRVLREAAGIGEPDRDIPRILGPKERELYLEKIMKENEKIRNMWIAYENDAFICDSLRVVVRPISVLKLAVTVNFGAFITDVVTQYKVPLNRIDRADGKTVLDFIDDEIEKNKKIPIIVTQLNNYHKRIRKAGGKYAWELKNEKR